MKQVQFSLLVSVSLMATAVHAQSTKVLLDNEKVRITEYVSRPGEDVCGKGLHTHGDHATILLTDAQVKAVQADNTVVLETYLADKHLYRTKANGAVKEVSTDGTFWAKGATHRVTNVGKKEIRFYIVETK